MFHLVNEFGNVHKIVQSEAKKNEMLKDGWKVVEEMTESPLSPDGDIPPLGKGGSDVTPYNGPQQADEPVSAPDDPSIMHTTESEQSVAVSAEPKKKPKGKTGKKDEE